MDIKFLDLQAVNALHGDEIRNAVGRVVDSGWYLHGEATRMFESHFADYIGTKCCVGVANGLDALSLMLRAYKETGRLSDGDEIIVPSNTFVATILAITGNGLVPVFAEPSADTLEIDDAQLEDLLSPRTRAVMIVHLYGRCAFTERVGAFCREHRLLLLEDNAQAHGCCYCDGEGRMRRTGSLGDAAAHSFYPGKNLGAMGDGGAVTTNDETLAAVVRSLGNYGFAEKYICQYKGCNSRLDEVQAAVLDVKLAYLDDDNAIRQAVADIYYNDISNPLVRLPKRLPHINNVYHLFPVFCQRRDDLQRFLAERGVHTLIHYPVPPHRQSCYEEYASCVLPVTEKLASEELSLPISPAMSVEEARYVARCINEFK